MRLKFRVVLAVSAIALTLLGSACTPIGHTSATRHASANTSGTSPDFPTFKNNDYTLSANWVNHYWSGTARLLGADNCLRDTYGICVEDREGKLYNHPVVQANDGLYSLATYEKNGNSAYLKQAEAEANRLLSYKTSFDNAWWYPYEFTFKEYGKSYDTITAPWYSAYAQGDVLDLFTQLYKVTRMASWKVDADRTFTSFLDPWTSSTGTKPWVDIVDSSGYLWLEEYPTNRNDDVINGADFAIWGLVDYANVFHNAGAAHLASGALTTMLHVISLVRHSRWIVGYSVSHPIDENAEYHVIVTEQFLSFAEITAASVFARIALELASDFPIYPVTGAINLAAGPHLMAQVNGKLVATSVSTVQVPVTTTATVTARVKLANEPGFWYAVTTSTGTLPPGLVSIDQVGMQQATSLAAAAATSPYAGFFIQEQAGTAYHPGICNQFAFTPSLPTTFPAGSYLLYTSNGQELTGRSTMTLASPELLPSSSLETIGGITVWAISSGTYAGEFIAGAAPTVGTMNA